MTRGRTEQPTTDRGESAIGSSLSAGLGLVVVGGTTTEPVLAGVGLLVLVLVAGVVVADDPPA